MVVSALKVELKLGTSDTSFQNTDVNLVSADHMGIFEFLLEVHLKLSFERR